MILKPSRKHKLLTQRRERDLEERRARLDAASSEGLRLRPLRKIATRTRQEAAPAVVKPANATITEPITVKDLAAALAVKVSDVIAKLMRQNLIATANQIISTEVAELVCDGIRHRTARRAQGVARRPDTCRV